MYLFQRGQEITVKVVCAEDAFQVYIDDTFVGDWSHIHNGEYPKDTFGGADFGERATTPVLKHVEIQTFDYQATFSFALMTGVKWEYGKNSFLNVFYKIRLIFIYNI